MTALVLAVVDLATAHLLAEAGARPEAVLAVVALLLCLPLFRSDRIRQRDPFLINLSTLTTMTEPTTASF